MKETSVSDEMIVCTFPTRNVTENEIILHDIIGGSNIAFMKQKRTQKKQQKFRCKM